MPEDLVSVLAQFHRDVILPDMQRVVRDAVGESEGRLRNEMQTFFDSVLKRLDRLEGEYHMVTAGLKRVEEHLDRMDAQMSRLALKSEVEDLKARVKALEKQIADIEARL